ncbi:MAG: sulfate permease [Flavobacteriaceae bacterium]|nr:sulfate permease [Flavobacteriaceae bacterium]
MIARFFPIIKDLLTYNQATLFSDLIAGLSIAVIVIPQGLAYAMIAGLPPIYGLYAALIPQLIHGILGTSRHPAVGPVALDSLVVAIALGALSLSGIGEVIAAAVFLATMVGVLQLIMGLLQMGVLANYLSRPVISGFTSAAAIIIGLSQVEHLLGLQIESSNQIQKMILSVLQNFNETHLITVAVGLSAMSLILITKKYLPKFPSALIVSVFGVLLIWSTRWDLHGVEIVGYIPAGLPDVGLLTVSPDLMRDMLPFALTLAVIGYVEIISITKELEEQEEKYSLKPNKELMALGTANLVGSFFQSYPVSASFSRSAVKFQAGAKTGMTAVFSALIVGLTLLFFTSLIFYLPIAVLAGIIMVAVIRLINVRYAIDLYKTRRDEFFLLLMTCLLTLFVGITEGILIGALLSLLLMVIRTSKPHYAVLAKVSGTNYYKNISRFETDTKIDDDILIMRFDAQLFFGNRDYFRKIVFKEMEKKPNLKGFVLVARGITYIDSSGLSTLGAMIKSFQQKGILFMVAGAIGPARDVLQQSKLTDLIQEKNMFAKTADAIDYFKGKVVPSDVQKKIASQTNH